METRNRNYAEEPAVAKKPPRKRRVVKEKAMLSDPGTPVKKPKKSQKSKGKQKAVEPKTPLKNRVHTSLAEEIEQAESSSLPGLPGSFSPYRSQVPGIVDNPEVEAYRSEGAEYDSSSLSSVPSDFETRDPDLSRREDVSRRGVSNEEEPEPDNKSETESIDFGEALLDILSSTAADEYSAVTKELLRVIDEPLDYYKEAIQEVDQRQADLVDIANSLPELPKYEPKEEEEPQIQVKEEPVDREIFGTPSTKPFEYTRQEVEDRILAFKDYLDKPKPYRGNLSSGKPPKKPIQRKQLQSSKIAVQGTMSSTTKALPTRTSRDAPQFNEAKPLELERYFKDLEDLFTACGITADQDKKEAALKYVAPHVEESWKLVKHMKTGTWAEFKTDVIAEYPEAKWADEGSLIKLKQLMKENQRISEQDVGTLLSFKRQFEVQARRLTTEPALLTDHTIIGYFTSCLTDSFRDRLFASLDGLKIAQEGVQGLIDDFKQNQGTTASTSSGQQPPAAKKVRHDSRYTFEEVLKRAVEMALAKNPHYDTSGSGREASRREKNKGEADTMLLEEMETVREEVAMLKDQLLLAAKKQEQALAEQLRNFQQQNQQSQVVHSVEQFQQETNTAAVPPNMGPVAPQGAGVQPQPQVNAPYYTQQNNTYPQGMNSAPRYPQTHGPAPQNNNFVPKPMGAFRTSSSIRCHYCHGIGHVMQDCNIRQGHINEGKITVSPDGKMRFDNGWVITWGTQTPIRKMVDDYHFSRQANYQNPPYEPQGPVKAGPAPGMITVQGIYPQYYQQDPYDPRDVEVERLKSIISNLELQSAHGESQYMQVPGTGNMGQHMSVPPVYPQVPMYQQAMYQQPMYHPMMAPQSVYQHMVQPAAVPPPVQNTLPPNIEQLVMQFMKEKAVNDENNTSRTTRSQSQTQPQSQSGFQ